MSTKCLIRFEEFGPGMGFPSMKDFFNDTPYKGQDKVIAYLKRGRKTYSSPSISLDYFTGDRIPGENCGMTDGEYSWHNDLIHYVDKYNLRLPRDFEKKALETMESA